MLFDFVLKIKEKGVLLVHFCKVFSIILRISGILM